MALSKQGACQAPNRPKLCKLHLVLWLYEYGLNKDH